MPNILKAFSLFFLIGSTFLVKGMEESRTTPSSELQIGLVPAAPTKQKDYLLPTALAQFEAGEWKVAYKSFKKMGKAGGLIGSAYMSYMEKKAYVDPTIDFVCRELEPIPGIGQNLSQEYLSASLASMEPEKAKKVKKLAPLVGNNNAHAVSLMVKLCADPEIIGLLKKEKKFEKIRLPEDLFKNFKPHHREPVGFWNCLDPDYLLYLYTNRTTSDMAKKFTPTELKYFAENYNKRPEWVGKLACTLAENKDTKMVRQPLFWAHLAVENGFNQFCGTLGNAFLRQAKFKNASRNLTSEQRHCLELFRYYLSRVQQNDLVLPQAIELITACASDYEKGHYGDKDLDKSCLFDQKAADFGDSVAQYNYALRCQLGKGIKKDSNAALKYYKHSADAGNKDAQYNYAVMCLNGEGCEVDLNEALHYFKLAEAQGDKDATTAIIQLLPKMESNLQELKAYADQGNAKAQYRYAMRCYEQETEVKNFEEMRFYLEKAANHEDKYAQCNFALMLYGGMGGETDLFRAREYYKKAADHGVAVAQYNYATMLVGAQGGEKDLKTPKIYYEKAALQGFVEANLALYTLAEEKSSKERQDKDKQGAQEQPLLLEEDIEIVLPLIKDETQEDLSNKDESKLFVVESPVCLELLKAETPVLKLEAVPAHEVDKEEEELVQLLIKRENEITEFRAKKQAQKKAAEETKMVLKMKRKDYEATKHPRVQEMQVVSKKSSVAYETFEFIKTIFGEGQKKINAFSNKAAKQAFVDLGCEVKNKARENSTKLKFRRTDGRVVSLKYHNPHGQGEDMYDDLKPHIKRFLQAINKMPDTLQSSGK